MPAHVRRLPFISHSAADTSASKITLNSGQKKKSRSDETNGAPTAPAAGSTLMAAVHDAGSRRDA